MSFTTPSGSFGTRKPPKLMLRLNRLFSGGIRRRDGRFMGMDALVLTTVGAKTGKQRSTPLARFPGPAGSWHVVASAAGAATHPAWYHNLAAHPDQVTVEVARTRAQVTATELHGAERDEAWRHIVAASPRFGGYEQKTDRQMPVVRLTPRG